MTSNKETGMTRVHLATAGAAVLLGISAASPAWAAEKGWYIGTGVGYADSKIDDSSVNQQLSAMNPGATTTAITNDTTGMLYKLFLGYSFSSFVAVEANAFWMGTFGFDATTNPAGTYTGTVDAYGLSMDVLGIIPLGPNWRIFGRAGGIWSQTTANLYTNIGGTVTTAKNRDYDAGYKFGAGVAYEFESGVAFRAEWEQYHISDGMDGTMDANVYSGSVLYRFK
jgi:opacity protein-like surface antigen